MLKLSSNRTIVYIIKFFVYTWTDFSSATRGLGRRTAEIVDESDTADEAKFLKIE